MTPKNPFNLLRCEDVCSKTRGEITEFINNTNRVSVRTNTIPKLVELEWSKYTIVRL